MALDGAQGQEAFLADLKTRANLCDTDDDAAALVPRLNIAMGLG